MAEAMANCGLSAIGICFGTYGNETNAIKYSGNRTSGGRRYPPCPITVLD